MQTSNYRHACSTKTERLGDNLKVKNITGNNNETMKGVVSMEISKLSLYYGCVTL
jgi:hypothetical protein